MRSTPEALYVYINKPHAEIVNTKLHKCDGRRKTWYHKTLETGSTRRNCICTLYIILATKTLIAEYGILLVEVKFAIVCDNSIPK